MSSGTSLVSMPSNIDVKSFSLQYVSLSVAFLFSLLQSSNRLLLQNLFIISPRVDFSFFLCRSTRDRFLQFLHRCPPFLLLRINQSIEKALVSSSHVSCVEMSLTEYKLCGRLAAIFCSAAGLYPLQSSQLSRKFRMITILCWKSFPFRLLPRSKFRSSVRYHWHE